jgi:hypothetical protein
VQGDTIEVAGFADRVVAVRLVDGAAIIPDHDVAVLPFVAVLELLLDGVIEELQQ